MPPYPAPTEAPKIFQLSFQQLFTEQAQKSTQELTRAELFQTAALYMSLEGQVPALLGILPMLFVCVSVYVTHYGSQQQWGLSHLAFGTEKNFFLILKSF